MREHWATKFNNYLELCCKYQWYCKEHYTKTRFRKKFHSEINVEEKSRFWVGIIKKIQWKKENCPNKSWRFKNILSTQYISNSQNNLVRIFLALSNIARVISFDVNSELCWYRVRVASSISCDSQWNAIKYQKFNFTSFNCQLKMFGMTFFSVY